MNKFAFLYSQIDKNRANKHEFKHSPEPQSMGKLPNMTLLEAELSLRHANTYYIKSVLGYFSWLNCWITCKQSHTVVQNLKWMALLTSEIWPLMFHFYINLAAGWSSWIESWNKMKWICAVYVDTLTSVKFEKNAFKRTHETPRKCSGTLQARR